MSEAKTMIKIKSSWHYKRSIIIAAVLSQFFLGYLVWERWVHYRDFNNFFIAGAKFFESNTRLAYLCEAMSMSAKMAAVTGEAKWEARYKAFEPQLKQTVQAMTTQSTGIADAAVMQKIINSCDATAKIETQVFVLLRQGKKEPAQTFLNSKVYNEAQKNCAVGLNEARNQLANKTKVMMKAESRRLSLALILTLILLPLLLAAWIFVIRLEKKNYLLRKAAEDALLESEEKFRILFTDAPDPLFIVCDGVITDCNHATEALLRTNRNALIGKPPSNFSAEFQPDGKLSSVSAQEKINQAYSQGMIKFEWLNRRLDGSEFYTEVSLDSIVVAGKPFILGCLHDISERKQAAVEIERKNKELLQANSCKDKFLSIIAHDLRGPFNGFLGMTQMMADSLPELTHSEIQRISLELNKSASDLYRFLNNLLNWSRMREGLVACNPEIVHLEQCINDSITLLLALADNKHLKIICTIDNSLAVIADRSMLQTIIRNLVSNAIKFTPDGGAISITALQLDNGFIEISVKDSGIGMSREIINDLFHIDAKANRRGTNGETGTGLGLLLCKEFAEKNGGGIIVESEPNQGALFRVALPGNKVSTELTRLNSIEVTGHSAKQLKIIVADDDENSQLLLSILLKPFAKQLLTATTGNDAIALCRNNPDVDLILMDIAMPGTNGIEAAKQIRAFNTNVIIIAQSAHVLETEQKQMFDSGCNSFIAKPYDKNSLSAVIRKFF
jgi:PAS domain S-box-containing protein